MNKALGQMIFNGSLLFLSISFGLFPSNPRSKSDLIEELNRANSLT